MDKIKVLLHTGIFSFDYFEIYDLSILNALITSGIASIVIQ
jgi:hypothetical protein